MSTLATIFGLFGLSLGLVGLFSPATLVQFSRLWLSQRGLNATGAIRVGFGLALTVAAPASRWPQLIQLLGLVLLISGAVTPFVGVDRARRYVNGWASCGPVFVRVWACAALLIGSVVVFAVVS